MLRIFGVKEPFSQALRKGQPLSRKYSSDPAQCASWKLTAVQKALKQGVLSPSQPLAMIWNTSMIARGVAEVNTAFPGWCHTTAAKANPLLGLFHLVRDEGLGAEAASLGELTQALYAGFAPEKIMFDSPTKTPQELDFALKEGVNINVDNLQELQVLAGLVSSTIPRQTQLLGVRVNPEVGAGAIDTHSTSVPWSKFGVGLLQYRQELLAAYSQHEWLRCVHVHTGSQGCPLELIAQAVRRVVDFALEVNKSRGFQQITAINIGGGLPVNFTSEAHTPSFQEFSRLLRLTVPELFNGDFQVITEHGRRYFAKEGVIVSHVEYTKLAGDRHIALQHAGADVCVRTIYHPETWPLRCTVLDSQGNAVNSLPEDLRETDVAGPCCIAGDIVVHRKMLPPIQRGNYIILHDVGAYYHSSWSYYNSRQAPGLYGFSEEAPGSAPLQVFKQPASVEDTLRHYRP